MNQDSQADRNDPCPCGSGLKYKKCCMNAQPVVDDAKIAELYMRNYRISLKSPKDIAGMKKTGLLVVDTLR
ncbi:MAG: SEC-C metal-binding domain-containing protein, partial [Candidatus Riflebacteria bacterium]|nr:SEC-C metal-binding domain-containing protein [Candidatus Riflebacteria bacterium]